MITLTNMERNTIQLFEAKIGKTFENQVALEQHLTERFNQFNTLSQDAQKSYNKLNDELDGLLLANSFAYALSGDHKVWAHQPGQLFEAINLADTGVDVRKSLNLPTKSDSESTVLFDTKNYDSPKIVYFG